VSARSPSSPISKGRTRSSGRDFPRPSASSSFFISRSAFRAAIIFSSGFTVLAGFKEPDLDFLLYPGIFSSQIIFPDKILTLPWGKVNPQAFILYIPEKSKRLKKRCKGINGIPCNGKEDRSGRPRLLASSLSLLPHFLFSFAGWD